MVGLVDISPAMNTVPVGEQKVEVYGVSITEVDADALVYEVDDAETKGLREKLAAKDDRTRGLGPFEVNEAGEELFQTPDKLGTRVG